VTTLLLAFDCNLLKCHHFIKPELHAIPKGAISWDHLASM